MTTNELELEIGKIRDEILVLSSMVEKAMLDSALALRNHDFETSGKILHGDLHFAAHGCAQPHTGMTGKIAKAGSFRRSQGLTCGF